MASLLQRLRGCPRMFKHHITSAQTPHTSRQAVLALAHPARPSAACQAAAPPAPPAAGPVSASHSSSTAVSLQRMLHGLSSTSTTSVQLPAAAPAADPEVLRIVEEELGPLDKGPLIPPAPPVVIVISGPSGVGKDAVIQRLKQLRPDLYFVVTATSRPQRPGEVDGKDYFFVSKAQFESWVAEGQLLEHALVYGQYKGIPRQQVDQALAAGTDVVLRLDVQGAATVRAMLPGVISIFIAAESEDALVRRLVARKTETKENLLKRVRTARQEMQCIQEFDYVVINADGELERCARQLGEIIDAEKARTARRLAQQQDSTSGAGHAMSA